MIIVKTMNKYWHVALGLAVTVSPALAGAADDLMPPVMIEAGGKPIDVGAEIGHAAPFVADFDGNGKPDLLVGHFRGNLRIYPNEGGKNQPIFKDFQLLKAGGADAKVPTG